jgi:hypothetical protein
MQLSRTDSRFFLGAMIAGLCFSMLACTPKIPNKITAREMDLYREWLKQRFATTAPKHLYLDDQTFAFDPLRQEGCGKALNKNDDVPNVLMRALHNLGMVDSAVDVSPKTFHLPWPHQVLDVRNFPSTTEGLHVISFSRVAFDGSGTQALFAVSDLCGLQCGSGHAVFAKKENGGWRFKDSVSCTWKD